jgi:hypothetical protein
MPRQLGPWLVAFGALLVVAGLIAWRGGLAWFGHLPGDIRIEGARARVYVPITSMLIVSAVLSGLLWLIRRLG